MNRNIFMSVSKKERGNSKAPYNFLYKYAMYFIHKILNSETSTGRVNICYSAAIVTVDKTIISYTLYPASYPTKKLYPILSYPIISYHVQCTLRSKR